VAVDTALYFPYIRVPQSTWFTRVLLYWDNAASIIPASIYDDQQERGDYTSELMRAGLLRAVTPERNLDFQFEAFSSGFLSLLEAHPILDSLDTTQKQLIHEEKMSSEVYRQLETRGLAQRLPDGYGWWLVESRTAALYMAYLTGTICGADRNLFPVTDSAEIMAFLQPIGSAAASRLQSLRYEVLTQALPAPSRPVSVRELQEFKDSWGDDLRRLRRHLSGELARIAAIDDPDIRDATKDSLFQDIEDQVARLREQMSRRGWPRIVFVGLAGVVGAAAATANAFITPASALIHGLEIGSTIAAMGPALAQAADTVHHRHFDADSPFVYAAAVAEAL
jgi:hypothetical protein